MDAAEDELVSDMARTMGKFVPDWWNLPSRR